MFVCSFKASKIKAICILFVCVFAFMAVISILPEADSSLNVNKIEGMKDLSKINVKKEEGRLDYFSSLGYSVKKEHVLSKEETLPKELDVVHLKYNELQRKQGYDLSKYCGKKVVSYTYEVTSLPDNTTFSEGDYLATIICYKDKVVSADIVNVSTNEYMPLVKAI